jgi:hypothetical protein
MSIVLKILCSSVLQCHCSFSNFAQAQLNTGVQK